MIRLSPFRIAACAVLLSIVAISAENSYAAPVYSSRPGAAYTLYLDFDGFNFDGQWGNTGDTPGNTTAYSQTAQIAEIWARTAEKYSSFNINVTTVDPSGLAATNYTARQTYYDSTPQVMHTVVGGNGSWIGSPGGISYVGVAPYNYGSGGYKTNWVFTDNLGPNVPKYIAEAAGHENGHALGLNHQNDVSGTSDYSTNNDASGNNSYAPIMGVAYGSQKGTWSVGTINKSATDTQNDVAVILANPNMSLIDDAIGHSFATASALPLTGTTINSTVAGGVITPLVGQTPNPLGIDNYTKDYFKFRVGTTGTVTFSVKNGGDWVTAGTVDPGFTLRSKLNIFSSTNLTTALAFGTESADVTATTFSGTLAAGDYYAQITSFGGYQSTFDTQRQYFDMGSYTLSGSGFSPLLVPEPGTFGLLGLGIIGVVIGFRRRK